MVHACTFHILYYKKRKLILYIVYETKMFVPTFCRHFFLEHYTKMSKVTFSDEIEVRYIDPYSIKSKKKEKNNFKVIFGLLIILYFFIVIIHK